MPDGALPGGSLPGASLPGGGSDFPAPWVEGGAWLHGPEMQQLRGPERVELGGATTMEVFRKDPAATQRINIPFAALVGRTGITGVTAEPVPSDSGLTVTKTAFDVIQRLVAVWVTGGEEGGLYDVRVTVTTQDEQTLPYRFQVEAVTV